MPPFPPSARPIGGALRRPTLALLACLTLALVLAASLAASASAAERAFSNRYAQTLKGDIAVVANANSSCSGTSPQCDPMATANPPFSGNPNNRYGTLVDVDADATTTNSSRADLQLPAGSTIRAAYLFWASAGDGTDGNGEQTVKFKTPATAAYQNVTATLATQCGSNPSGSNRGFSCGADVTGLVTAGGSGSYTVASIEQRPNDGQTAPDHWSGWTLYVVFENQAQPLRRLVVADGYRGVSNGTSITIPVSGFRAPPQGTVKATMRFSVGEGDFPITGDNATFGTKSLDTAATPNLMRSAIDGLAYQSSRTPANVNTYGFDTRRVDVDGAIANDATSANFTFNTTGDVYYPFALGMAIQLGEPNLVLDKQLNDLNGGVVEGGDVLEYTITATNSGDDGADRVSIRDPLPAGVTYVPGSLSIVSGANAGAKTDATGDDQAWFAGGEVNANLGTGATPSQGGVLPAFGGQTVVRFRAVVDSNAQEGAQIRNTVYGSYIGQTSQVGYADPSSIATTPVRRADMVVRQTATTPLVAGSRGTITATARNDGGATTKGQPVTLTLDVPADVQFEGITSAPGWSCSASLPTITCDRTDNLAAETDYPAVVYDVTPRQSASSLTFGARVAGGFQLNTANDTGNLTRAVERRADLKVTNVVDQDRAGVGQTLEWTVGTTNAGPSDTSSASLSFTLPAEVDPATAQAVAGTCTRAGAVLTCPLGALPTGASAEVRIRATATPAAAGRTLTATAGATGPDPDPTPADATAQATTDVRPAADLRVTAVAAPQAPNPGQDVTFTVTVRNDGPGTARATRLVDVLPAELEVQAITPSAGSCVAGPPVDCTLGDLAPGASETIAIRVRTESADAGRSFENRATASTVDYDPDASNDEARTTVQVVAAADLRTTIAVDRASARVGDTLTWTVRTTNDGPLTVGDGRMVMTLPAGLVPGPAPTPAGGSCAWSGQTLTCQLPSLASGEAATVTVTGSVDAGAAGRTLSVGATATSASTTDLDPSNDAGPPATTSVAERSDLRLAMTVDRPSAQVGDTLTYLLTVSNDGPQTATNVRLDDVLPAELTRLGVTPAQGTCAAGTPIACDLGSIVPGSSTTVQITARVEAAAATRTVVNPASVRADQEDPTPGDRSASASTSVGASADLQLTKTADRTTANVGDTVTWTITARNAGPSDATGVTVTDVVPAGVTITSATSTVGTCSGTGPVRCDVGGLASGAQATITVVGTVGRAAGSSSLGASASVIADQPDPATANNSASATTTVGPSADLQLTKSVDRTTPNVGQSVTWTLRATNDGPQAATQVTITDRVPAGARIDAVTPTSGTCSVAGQDVSCVLGTVASGATASVEIRATVLTEAGGQPLDNTATVGAAESDPDRASNTATVRATAVPVADLSVTITPDRPTVNVGERASWTVVAANAGPSSAADPVVTVTLPEGLTDIRASVPDGTCSIAGRVVTCSLRTLPSGASAQIALSGIVPADAANRSLSVDASASGATADPTPSNNARSSASVQVPDAVDLVVEKEADRPAAQAQETVNVTTRVRNAGPGTATSVRYVEQLPEGVVLESLSISQGSCTVEGRQITCDIGTLADGSLAELRVRLRVRDQITAGELTNAGSASSAEFDRDGANNAATVVTRVGTPAAAAPAPGPKLQVTKTASSTSPRDGDELTWTIRVQNVGAAPATGVRIVDSLPAGLGYLGTKVVGGTCTRSARTVTCLRSVLEPGQSVEVAITTKVLSGGLTIENVATATSAELPDPASSGSAGRAAVRTAGGPFLVLGVKPLERAVRPGGRVRIAVKLTNVGRAEARDSRGCFTLPRDVVLTRRPAGLTQQGRRFCLSVPRLAKGKHVRRVLTARVVGSAGRSQIEVAGTSANSRVNVNRWPVVVRGARQSRGGGVTG